MDLRFNSLFSLHLLWVVLVLAGVVVYGFARRRRLLERFASADLVGFLTARVSPARRRTKAVLVLAALAFLVLAMIDPRWGVYYEEVPRRGIDIMFALDVSRSMLAGDLAPNRLQRARQYIGDVVALCHGDRVGLVTFAGAVVLKCPLTADYGAFRMILDEVDVRSSPRGGTLIGDAVRQAADSFIDQDKGYKAIVVLTDGEDHESFPVDAAREAFKDKGIRVYTVGIGDESLGARVPAKDDNTALYLRYDDQEVWSKMNPQILRDMALAGGGAYVPAGTKVVDLGQLLYEDRIANQDKREFETGRIELRRVQYQWFAAAALLLLLVEVGMTDRRLGADRY
ncbi:MAG TPA: VWA domain-containing protein [Phycisphaerae bacterium]|nr:VWA domain-containing protein [Phycisphaerae bacterium]